MRIEDGHGNENENENENENAIRGFGLSYPSSAGS